MQWLNVSMAGLQGHCHPILKDVVTAYEVKKMRCQVKMLCGDLYTYSVKADQSGGSPHCRLCQAPCEDLPHVLSICEATSQPRQDTTQELKNILVNNFSLDGVSVTKSLTNEQFSMLVSDPILFAQFAVDATSFNLPDIYRVNINDINICQIFKITRNFCYSINLSLIHI